MSPDETKRPKGITEAQWWLLGTSWRTNNGRLSDYGVMGKTRQALLAKGLVERRLDIIDETRRHELTQAMHTHIKAARSILMAEGVHQEEALWWDAMTRLNRAGGLLRDLQHQDLYLTDKAVALLEQYGVTKED